MAAGRALWLSLCISALVVGALAEDPLADQPAELSSLPQHRSSATADENHEIALVAVPEDITCYHELSTKVKAAGRLAQDKKEEATIEHTKFAHAAEVAEGSLRELKSLDGILSKQKKAAAQTKDEYEKTHGAAMSVYELAKAALRSYTAAKHNSEKQTANSQVAMSAYLKYKELTLQSNERGDQQSAARYDGMANKFLAQYQSLEKSIQADAATATKGNAEYQRLSEQYDTSSKQVSELQGAAERSSRLWATTQAREQHLRAVHAQAGQDAQRARDAADKAEAAAEAARTSFERLTSQMRAANLKFKMADAQTSLLLSKEAKAVDKLASYRSIAFQFKTRAQQHREAAEAAEKGQKQFDEKYQAAAAATEAFSDAYESAGCGQLPHRVAAKQAAQQQLEHSKQEATLAMELAGEELAQAHKVQQAAMQPAQAADTLGEARIPDYQIRFDEFQRRFKQHTQHKDSTVVDGAVSLLQEGTAQHSTQLCEHTERVAMLDWHAKEAAAMQRDQHTEAGKAQRSKQTQAEAGLASSQAILKKAKVEREELAAQLVQPQATRQSPC